jgi:hypothetical protein
VAKRITAAIAVGDQVVFPDNSAAAGEVYLSNPLKLEQMLAG